MEAQIYLQKTLREKLDELKLKNSSFSLRAFARLLEISPASLSEFLNGKRVLSEKMIKKLAIKLSFSPSQYNELIKKINIEKNRLPIKSEHLNLRKKVHLQDDQYFLVADWHYYAILCLVETKDFKKDYEWIARKLNTTASKVKECFERLLRLGYLSFDKSGNIIYEDIELDTTMDIPNTSLKRRHGENLDAAHLALQTQSIERRDFSFMTLAVDHKKIPQVKKMIERFQDELEEFLKDGEKTQVYEFCMQMFPRTKEDI
ncbi:MAG: TIGR02147 family protein [Bacteriovoracaceae bacterium]|jgi:uncharacterized protein (TIGR02147 family)|nr:TIGR02147 family protein [Bacteriovoracaceae bacterium]